MMGFLLIASLIDTRFVALIFASFLHEIFFLFTILFMPITEDKCTLAFSCICNAGIIIITFILEGKGNVFKKLTRVCFNNIHN